jgi:phage shock protein C
MQRTTRTRLTGVYRSRDGIFLGVCGGIAERFNFSPWGVRLLFIALQLTIVHLMFLVYIALGLILRRDPVERFHCP